MRPAAFLWTDAHDASRGVLFWHGEPTAVRLRAVPVGACWAAEVWGLPEAGWRRVSGLFPGRAGAKRCAEQYVRAAAALLARDLAA